MVNLIDIRPVIILYIWLTSPQALPNALLPRTAHLLIASKRFNMATHGITGTVSRFNSSNICKLTLIPQVITLFNIRTAWLVGSTLLQVSQRHKIDHALGPLLIHGPSSADWDEEWAPVLMTDWIHESAFELFQTELGAMPPTADSLLLDGQGEQHSSRFSVMCRGW